MKIMSREFTRMEKILITALVLILIGLAYYQFIYKEVQKSIASSKAEEEIIQSELDVAKERFEYLTSIKTSMDDLEQQGNLTWMGSYNNSEAELAFLNDILANAVSYSISFSNVTRAGDQIRRNFSLQYTTKTYEDAQDIMKMLSNGENRCLIGDVSCNIGADGNVSMRQTATFYETMVDGQPDAALPQDSAAANS